MSVLVAGTSTDVGKSAIVAGLCRLLSRRGLRVSPFKAQNISLNSVATPDGAEIGRSQFSQALAARATPEAAMNPVLVKPATPSSSRLIVMGRPAKRPAGGLVAIACDALASLRERYDVVVCEGAGGIAEINLRDRDVANLGIARAASLPVVVVADIDRGGSFASLYGSYALLDDADRATVRGFVLNKFRGDAAQLAPGIERLRELTGRPTFGVLPWLDGPWIDAEDAVALDASANAPVGPGDVLTVALVRLPNISNFTDVEPLRIEPAVRVVVTQSPAEIAGADLVVLPGTKATVEDLTWLRTRGLDRVVRDRTSPTLGICGGYQMLGRTISDGVESRAGRVDGLGLLPVETSFRHSKIVRTSAEAGVTGYEIRHGRVRRFGGEPLFGTEGCRDGMVAGTSWHGIFESDAFRREFFGWVGSRTGRDWSPGEASFADARETMFERLADMLDAHADVDAMVGL